MTLKDSEKKAFQQSRDPRNDMIVIAGLSIAEYSLDQLLKKIPT